MADFQYMYNKVRFCERYVEIREYTRPFRIGSRGYDVGYDKSKIGQITERREDSLGRTRKKIFDLISCNIEHYPKFLTLTCEKSVLDYDEFLYLMKQFFKNMKRKGFDLKYIWVAEHQTERGLKEGNEGSYHAHVIIFNDEKIPFEIINSCWRGNTDIHILNGFRYKNNLPTEEKIKSVASYVVKYITKENLTEFKQNLYHCSRGLRRPLDIPEYYNVFLDNKGFIGEVQRCSDNINGTFDFFKNNSKVFNVSSFCMPIGTSNFVGCQISTAKIDNMYEKGGD